MVYFIVLWSPKCFDHLHGLLQGDRFENITVFLYPSCYYVLSVVISTCDSCLPPPPLGATAPSGQRPPHYRGFTITLRHITLGRDSSGRMISPPQRSVPDNTQHSQETYIHAAAGIRTDNPSKRAAADQRFRPRVHWDRPRLLPCSGYVWPHRTQSSILATQYTTLNAIFRNYILVLSSKPRWRSCLRQFATSRKVHDFVIFMFLSCFNVYAINVYVIWTV